MTPQVEQVTTSDGMVSMTEESLKDLRFFACMLVCGKLQSDLQT